MNTEKKGIAVYCASSTTLAPVFIDAARELGHLIAHAGMNLIDGAGRSGLMGAINDAVLEAGGTVTGVIPEFMYERGWHHKGLTELRIMDSMHTRKELMASLARGVIALPGGIGTFDELFEIITWRQLGLFRGNVAVLNVDGYFDAFVALIDNAVERGFMRSDHRMLFKVFDKPADALAFAMADAEEIVFAPKY